MKKKKVYTVQIDGAGHHRIEWYAEYYGLTQAGAASLVVSAAADDHIVTRLKAMAEKQGASPAGPPPESSEAGEVAETYPAT
jgi:hypothetical protein